MNTNEFPAMGKDGGASHMWMMTIMEICTVHMLAMPYSKVMRHSHFEYLMLREFLYSDPKSLNQQALNLKKNASAKLKKRRAGLRV